MKRIILTGASGFIGREILKILSREKIFTYAVIRDLNKIDESIKNLNSVKFISCDMENIKMLPEILHEHENIDTCIHLAWSGSTGIDRADYKMQIDNVMASMNLINALAKIGVKRFVGAGTLAERDVLNYHLEDGATPNSTSIYGVAKVSAHMMTKAECNRLNIDHIWVYISNTYGVGNNTNNFINMAAKKFLTGERAAFTAGEQVYDFSYITDTAKAIFMTAMNGKNNCAYYLGSTQARKLKEYIKIIRDTVDPGIELHLGEIAFNGRSLPESEYDTQKLVKDTGFKPEINFNEGIAVTIEWLKKILENNKK